MADNHNPAQLQQLVQEYSLVLQKSEDDSILRYQSQQSVLAIIQTFLTQITAIAGEDPRQWQVRHIRKSLAALFADTPATDHGELQISATSVIIQQFLTWLSDREILSIPSYQVTFTTTRVMTEALTAIGVDFSNPLPNEADDPTAPANDVLDDGYRTAPHVDTVGDRQWSLDTATQVHRQLIEDARATWEAAEDLRSTYDQDEVLEAIVPFGDALYAQFLETPDNWTAENVQTQLIQLMPEQTLHENQLLLGSWMQLLMHLIESGKLDRDHTAPIAAEFAMAARELARQNPEPTAQKPTSRMVRQAYRRRGKKRKKNKKRR